MKKLILFITFFLLFIFFSCSNGGNEIPQETNTENHHDENDNELPTTNNSTVIFKNESEYLLSLYTDSARTELFCSINKNENYTHNFENTDEKVFYITYNFDIGMNIPWCDTSCSIIVIPKLNDSITKVITSPKNIEVKSAYLVIENNSNKAIQLMRGANTPLNPCGGNAIFTNGVIANYGNSAIYEIRDASTTANLQLSQFKLRNALNSTENYELSANITSFSPGYVYNFSFNENSLDLVSIIPINQDTKNKIWSRTSSSSYGNCFVTQVFRSRKNKTNGSIILGQTQESFSSTKGQGAIFFIDEYGSTIKKAVLEIEKNDEQKATNYNFLDVLEDSNEKIIILAQLSFDNGETWENYIICRDSDFTTTLWIQTLPNNLIFRNESKGKIIEYGNNKYALCGACFVEDNNEYRMSYYILTIDSSDSNNVSLKQYIGQNPTQIGKEQLFTSMIYDSVNDSFICTGYDNFDGKYSLSDSHYGIIASVNSSLEQNTFSQVYKKERTLFFGIEQDSEKNWYACGEYADNGNTLHGCLINSSMNENEDPIILSTKNNDVIHCWFNQLCVEDFRIVLSGQCGISTNGSNAQPWVASVNKKGELCWENIYDKTYNCVFACMKNGIGSFLMELYNTKSIKSKIISTDLLGKDSGNELSNISIK